MADTNTANLGLLIADLNDTFNFGAHVEANFTTIDGLMGAVQCTSSTRPATTYAGQIIYETDSKRYVQNTGTKASPTWTYMSHAAMTGTSSARPTVGLSAGQMLYETDTKRLLTYSGSAWEQKAFANFVTTSGGHPSSPFQGLEIYETDTTMSAVYSGSNYQYGIQQVAPTQTVSAAASITFSSIPAVKRLLVVWRLKLATAAAADLEMRIDGSSASSYLWSLNTGRSAAMTVADGGGAVTFAKVGAVSGDTTNYGCNGALWIDGWNMSTTFCSWTGTANLWDSATSYWNQTASGQFNVVGPHTSLTLLPSASTITGEVTLYGAM